MVHRRGLNRALNTRESWSMLSLDVSVECLQEGVMRIAISGSHMVGKTTLVEALVVALPGYVMVPEPYHVLADEGHAFADMPSLEDFERQLECSIQGLLESGADVIFDRCPLDILGYLLAHRDSQLFQAVDWLAGIQESVARLDRIVFVPVEEPDRIVVPVAEARLRSEVDAVLRELILDDSYGLGFDVTLVSGSVSERLRGSAVI